MEKDYLQDGWEDCISVIKRLLDEQLDIEVESQRKWGHESALSIESFRKIVDRVLSIKE